MAKLEIPGIEVKLGRPKLVEHKPTELRGGGTYKPVSRASISVELRITSWWRLLWYAVKAEYEVAWYQWPWVTFVIVKKCLAEWVKGKWQAHTSSAS